MDCYSEKKNIFKAISNYTNKGPYEFLSCMFHERYHVPFYLQFPLYIIMIDRNYFHGDCLLSRKHLVCVCVWVCIIRRNLYDREIDFNNFASVWQQQNSYWWTQHCYRTYLTIPKVALDIHSYRTVNCMRGKDMDNS